MLKGIKAFIGVVFAVGLVVHAAVANNCGQNVARGIDSAEDEACNRPPVTTTSTTSAPLPTSTCNSTATPGPFQSIDFSNSPWIWTGENPTPGGFNPVGNRGFRKNISTPCENDKCATCATIIAYADDLYEFFVNGRSVGSGELASSTAQVFYTTLQSQDNLFAIRANNYNGPAGVAATVMVHYSDGSHDVIGTDETWRTLPQATLPANWTSPSFDDSSWSTAKSQGANGVSPWGATTIPPALSLTNSRWIWTSDVTFDSSTVNAPLGSRFFRKSHVATGKRAVCATMVLNTDDYFAVWANGVLVGTSTDWNTVGAYHVPNLAPQTNVFAVNGTNALPIAAGLIVEIAIVFDDGTTETVVSDSSWKASFDAPVGFQNPSFDDSAWEPATDIGLWGRPPWTSRAIPSA